MAGRKTVLLVATVVFATCLSNAADYYAATQSPWSLDPFLGTYDQTYSQQTNIPNITELLGIPANVSAKGERVTFAKYPNGTYYQTVRRSDPRFTQVLPFQLGVPGKDVLPGNGNLTYTYYMYNATTLLVDKVAQRPEFTVTWQAQVLFFPDASGYINRDLVTTPVVFTAGAPFRRVGNSDDGGVITQA